MEEYNNPIFLNKTNVFFDTIVNGLDFSEDFQEKLKNKVFDNSIFRNCTFNDAKLLNLTL